MPQIFFLLLINDKRVDRILEVYLHVVNPILACNALQKDFSFNSHKCSLFTAGSYSQQGQFFFLSQPALTFWDRMITNHVTTDIHPSQLNYLLLTKNFLLSISNLFLALTVMHFYYNISAHY